MTSKGAPLFRWITSPNFVAELRDIHSPSKDISMSKITMHRGLLVVLAAYGGTTGLWAYLSPRHWYDNFPGMGLTWLPQLGPYNEHFVKDAGAMFLALMVLSILTIVYVTTTMLKIAAATWLTFNALHFVYHITMLHMYSTRDAVLNVIVLTTALVCSVGLFIPVRDRLRVAQPAPGQSESRSAAHR
jgi:hypothetical protein